MTQHKLCEILLPESAFQKKDVYVNYFRSVWRCSDENKSIYLVFILLLIFQSDRLRDNIDWQCALFSRVTRDSPFTTWES